MGRDDARGDAGGWEAVKNWDAPPPTPPPPSATAQLRWQADGRHHGVAEMPLLGAVEEREEFVRFPPVKSPRLSRLAGLGYGQSQIGENFLQMAQYDKPEQMRRVLAPWPSPRVKQCAALFAGLAFFVVCAQLAMGSALFPHTWSPVHLFCLLFFCCCGTISLLPDPGISVHFRMLDDGVTALHVAAQYGSMSAARMLVAEGAALDLGDVDGRTPLHHAAIHMQDDLAKFLLARGADTHTQDAWGNSPYQLVPERGGQLWVALGGPKTTYEYNPDDGSLPGSPPETNGNMQESPPRNTAADDSQKELDRTSALNGIQQDQNHSTSERFNGVDRDSTVQTAARDNESRVDECVRTADGVVCSADTSLIQSSATVESGGSGEICPDGSASNDDPIPEEPVSNVDLHATDKCIKDDMACGGGSGGGVNSSSSSSSSDDNVSSSDDDLTFELEEPPVESLRPQVFSSTHSSSAEQPSIEGVEIPPGYTNGRSIGPLTAAAKGALDLLQQQYAREPTSLKRCDLSGRSCMVTALENGHIDIVEWLCNLPLKLPVESNEMTRNIAMDIRSWLIEESGIDSLRPLHHAILRREPRAVEALLQAGADTETRTRLSSRYTNGSIDGGVERVTRSGEREALSDADKTGLLLAVTVACHQASLAAVAEATGGSAFNPTRVMEETRASRTIIRLLLEFGADIHARDQEAYTSLHIAQEANVLPLMELLLEHGAAMDFREPVEGAVVETSLCWAARQRNTAQVKMLLRHGACVNALGRGGMAPLHFAARAGNLDTVCLLLDAGADHAMCWRGKTPEELAISNTHHDVATLLHTA